MGVEGQHHHLLNAIGLDVSHRRFGEGMPIAHGHIGGGFDLAMAELALELPRLVLGDPAQG